MKFPVKLYNAGGETYQVGSQEEFDFHITNGWTIEKVKPPVVEPPPKPPEMIDVEERLAIVEDALSGAATTDSVKELIKRIAELEKEVFIKKVEK